VSGFLSALARIAKLFHARHVLPVVGLSLLALAGPVLLASAFAITPGGVSADRRSPALLCESFGDGLFTGSASSSQPIVPTDDDNDNPRISIADAGVTEGDSGTTPMMFTVSKAGDPHGTTSVHYATQGGTASSGVDFASAEGVLHFPTGVMSRTLTVDVTADLLDELDETFFVNLSNPTGGHITDGQGQGTITNEDSSPVAASQSASTDEDAALPITLRVRSGTDVHAGGELQRPGELHIPRD
jgi:hypothetical protein